MARRRPPPKRPSATPSSLARKNSDTRRLVTPGPSFTDTEMTGFVRALLLGLLVAGVVSFLFYPDIARLLEHWEWETDTAQLQPDPQAAKDSKAASGRDKPPEAAAATPAKSESKAGKKARSVKETASGSKAGSKDSKGGGGTAKKAAKAAPPKRAKEAPPSPKESESTLECTCQQSTTSDPRAAPPPTPAPPKKAKSTKAKPPAKQDLMEGEEEEEEEVVEEEDSEVELMEIEESPDYIDLDTEEEASPDPEEEHSQEDGGEHSTEPVSLSEGQPITFTPVSPGDENVIRLGGRPKPAKDTGKEKADKRRSDAAASGASAQNSSAKNSSAKNSSAKNSSAKNSSAKNSPAKNSSSSTNDTATSRANKKPTSKAAAQSSKKSTPAGQQTGEGDSSEPDDLPPEVRDFKPTFLKTVTPKKIFADGRRIPPVELLPQKDTNSSVKVFLFNEFLSEAECDGLRRVHDKHVQEMNTRPLLCFDSLSTLRKHLQDVRANVRVTPNDFVQGTKCLNASFSQQLGEWMSGNWSYSTAFYPGESRFSTLFANRVDQAMGLDPRNGGKFQITSYPQGKAYKAHTDCVLDGTDPRDRVASVLVYLDDVEDGGETKFPELGIWVKPRKGRALVWNNMSPQGVCEPHSLHVASKVNQGSKYILIRWYYYKSFYSLGKRPPEPPLPSRPEGTPRVSCDDYDNGSCRWYDEWNNDHLLDYEYKKYTLI